MEGSAERMLIYAQSNLNRQNYFFGAGNVALGRSPSAFIPFKIDQIFQEDPMRSKPGIPDCRSDFRPDSAGSRHKVLVRPLEWSGAKLLTQSELYGFSNSLGSGSTMVNIRIPNSTQVNAFGA